MSINRTIRNFIIGKDHYLPSIPVYRNALLRGQISILAFFVGLFYIFTDTLFSEYNNLFLYGIVMAGSCLSFLLNRNEYYQTSTIALLLMANSVVFVITSSEGVSGGVQVFFIALSMAALILFGYKRIKLAFAFVIMSFVLFLIAIIFEFKLLGDVSFSEEYMRMSVITNFTGSMVACTLGIYFIILSNYKSEGALKGNQAKLFRLSDELKQSQERLETAIQGSKAGIYQYDVQTSTITLSSYWKNLMGYTDHELNGFTFDQFLSLIHPEDFDRTQESINAHIQNMQPYHNELRLKTKSGDYKWFYDSGLCKPDKHGNPKSVVGSIIDISDRKHAEEQIVHQNELLAKANEELDRFVYSASHDLRAPLSSLLGLITIAERTESNDEIMKCLTMMRDRINTMDGFIREITDYSRNSRLEISLEAVPIHAFVKGIIENLKYIEGADKIEIKNEIPIDLLVTTDMARLRVVISNLLANAFRYHDLTKSNPFIKIKTTNTQGMFRLSIQDNGQGISADHQTKIFNMFYRASEISDGSGLGLYIVRETLEKLSGAIEVQSDLGKGSTFTVTLPNK
jgi:PAS domain S-box-containing protein